MITDEKQVSVYRVGNSMALSLTDYLKRLGAEPKTKVFLKELPLSSDGNVCLMISKHPITYGDKKILLIDKNVWNTFIETTRKLKFFRGKEPAIILEERMKRLNEDAGKSFLNRKIKLGELW